ncbi:hypothetical protein DV738_g5524, partial [Chaetothyriales sp. CBS 135597]
MIPGLDNQHDQHNLGIQFLAWAVLAGILLYHGIYRGKIDVLYRWLRLRPSYPASIAAPPSRYVAPQKKPETVSPPGKEYASIFPPSRRQTLNGYESLSDKELSGNLIGFEEDFRHCEPSKYVASGFSVAEIKQLGDFPDYSKLSGIPPPEAYRQFDIDKALPRPYRPFRWSYHQTMSLIKMEPDWWLELENTYRPRIAQRKQLYEQYGESVLQYLPGSELACKELMEMCMQFLCTRYPHYFSLADDKKTFENKILGSTEDITSKHPLLVLLDHVPEDFAIMLRNPETGYYQFRAGVICSAIGWNLGAKINQQLHEIHAPVPHYKEKMQFSMDRFFAKMPTDKAIQRGSWGLEVDQPLYVPPGDPHDLDRGCQSAELTAARCHLRVDWQTLRRLPLSASVVFNFKAVFTPIEEFRDEPYIPSLILKVLNEGNEALIKYKNTWHVEHVVKPLLEQYKREQIESGIVPENWDVHTLDENWAAPNLPRVRRNAAEALRAKEFEPRLQKELSRLDPSVPFNPEVRYLHHTWAQTFFSRPEFFFQPSTVPELQKIVTLGRRLGKRICVTGFGHSPSDLSLTSQWLVNLDKLSRVLEWDVGGKPGLVRFEAGRSLGNLNESLAEKGYTLPNLGSINVQSVAGAISTGTHGSSLKHGLLSNSITALKILLSNSKVVDCSAEKNASLFRAALLSLGSLGIIVELTFQAVPDFNIKWSQSLWTLDHILDTWDTDLWTQQEYTRVWWLPYLSRAVIWRGGHTSEPLREPKRSFYGGIVGFSLYHNLLYLAQYIPSALPWIEWLIFGMQYGFTPGAHSLSAVQPARQGLLMDCLYSQFVNEWALPLSRGPEAIRRLSAWIHGDEATARIPLPSSGVWVHCPIEVRVSDNSTSNLNNPSGVRPYLAPTVDTEPTLYLNATLYRPYGRDPPCRARYFEAFEWLMRDMGGRPHWAKNFVSVARPEFEAMYGTDMAEFVRVRDEADPQGLFVGEWHHRNLPISDAVGFEAEEGVRRLGTGGDGLLWTGRSCGNRVIKIETADGGQDQDDDEDGKQKLPSPPLTSTSEESFDYMAKGEASVMVKEDGSGGGYYERQSGYFELTLLCIALDVRI